MKAVSVGMLTLVFGLGGAERAHGNEIDAVDIETGASVPRASPTETTAAVGGFLSFSQPAAVDKERAFAVGLVGYDTARKTGTFEATTEVRLWGPITARGGAVYANSSQTLRPSFGARVQILREARHGVDGALGVFYRPEGLTEAEGEIETVLSIGGRAGATYLLGNVLYGQDPEGNERDGEIRTAALQPLGSRFLAGVDARLRVDLGSQAAKLAQHHEATVDFAVGPTATAMLGPIAIALQAGGSGLRLQQRTSYGAFVMTGIGTAF